ncbi:MAG: hypothetical protein J6T57_03855 [Alphaproteobacteria bacterium]|nr:hypothetical protein [Alphaproteobacteria bacterium]
MDIRYFLDRKVGLALLRMGLRWQDLRDAGLAVRAARHVAWVEPFSDDAWAKLRQAKDCRRECFREFLGIEKSK